MIRTQVYLTRTQRDELAAIARASGRKQSELIRDALDRFLQEEGRSRRKAVLREAAGLWRDREDLPDVRDVRNGWDRG